MTTRVLVVEDSATQAAALSILLERSGYEVAVARSAERALAMLAGAAFDLVLSDVLMPGMDGYELCRRIKAQPAWRDMPVVLLTSLTDPLAIVRGLESGADNYVTKPYDPEALLARMHTVLERRYAPAVAHPKPFTVDLLGTPFTISATKEQILELLVSSYSDLVRTSEAVREAERRAQFLAEATELLSASLDVQVVLRDLARLAVPRLADVCAVDLLEGEELSRRVALAHDFGNLLPDAPAAPRAIAQPLSPIAQQTVTEGEIQVAEVATPGEIADVARDAVLVSAARGRGPYALLVVPLMSRRRVLGLLHILTPAGPRTQPPETLLLLEDLARRAAVALENARLYGEAQRATRARDDMLAIVSHDLRNPLNTIQMSTSFLLDVIAEGAADIPLVPQLQIIRRATTRGNALIQDLLDVSMIESGSLAVDPAPTSAAGLLGDAEIDLGPLVANKGARFECLWSGPDVMVPADKGRVAQVFSNLVGNAVKFTPASGIITLEGRVADGAVEFVVRDSGGGIAPDHLPHLFDRFWKATKASRSGAGLGLYIVKGIVEGHGGTIDVSSVLGESTMFRFTLPLAPG